MSAASVAPSNLYSIGDLAARCGVPSHRIDYLINTRRIKPVTRAGGIRLFDERALARIADELEQIQRRKVVDWTV